MSDPTEQPPTNGGTSKGDNQKPTRALPTDRVGFEKQTEVLRAYGAVAEEEAATSSAISTVVQIHPSSVSVCNPFFLESGLIEKAGTGYKAGADVAAFHHAMEWDPETAGAKLAPTLRDTWYWKVLQPRLTLGSRDEAEAVRVLAEECRAGPSYRPQIKLILDYLTLAGIIVRDGGQIKRGPQASAGEGNGATSTPAKPPSVEPHQPPTPPVKPTTQQTAFAGVGVEASIRVTEREIASWSPEQIREFFAGLAAVIAAKNRGGGEPHN